MTSPPPWIVVNERLQYGIGLINKISTDTFVLLLQRIVKSKEENIFTDVEYKKLEESLKLNSKDQQFTDYLRFDSDKADEFVKIWTILTKEDFNNLESRTILEDMSWEFNLELASQNGIKEAVPKARIKFKLCEANQSSKKNIVFQLKEDELLNMYNKLEDMQNTLDLIHRNSK